MGFIHTLHISISSLLHSIFFFIPLSLMAQLRLLRAQIAVVLVLLALSAATARPCRTFLISSYTFSFPSDNNDPSTATLTTFTEIHSFIPLHPKPPSFPAEIFLETTSSDENNALDRRSSQIRSSVPFGFSADDFSSLRDRTKDILSVVVALLFGVGCGALTAATMYLVWSMFSTRYDYRSSYEAFLDDDEDHDGEDEKIESPKKFGYVKIPAAEAVPAKEAV